MREEMRESIQINLENYAHEEAHEEANDRAKGDCCGVKIENLRYYKGWLEGWLVGVCMALNLTMTKEGEEWFIRNGRRQVIARYGHS